MKSFWGVATIGLCIVASSWGESGAGDFSSSFPPFTEGAFTPFNPETLNLTEAGLELTDSGVAYATLDERLADTSITVEASFTDTDAESFFLGVRVQARPPLSGYVFDFSRNGDVSLVELLSGGDRGLASANVGITLGNDPVMVCYRLTQQSLAAWVWPKGEPQPEEPSIQARLDLPLTFTDGRPLVGVRGGGSRFASIDVSGNRFRPEVLGFQPLSSEVRLRISWPSEAERVYRIDSSTDRVVWEGLYLYKASGETSEAVTVGSFSTKPASFQFLRVIDVATNTPVQANPAPLIPATPRHAIAWNSAEDRVYGFEWSQDLVQWTRFEGLAVPGADGAVFTDTVLPLPEELGREDADRLYLRVLDLDNDEGFGVISEDPEVP